MKSLPIEIVKLYKLKKNPNNPRTIKNDKYKKLVNSIKEFPEMLELRPHSFIVWDKCSIGLGSGYRNQHELILFYGKLNHNSESNVWQVKRDTTSEYKHPTQKPIAIPHRGIKNSTKTGNLVADPFLGSGSTMVAAHQLNRKCYGMELDPKYCQVIIDRMKALDPEIQIKKISEKNHEQNQTA